MKFTITGVEVDSVGKIIHVEWWAKIQEVTTVVTYREGVEVSRREHVQARTEQVAVDAVRVEMDATDETILEKVRQTRQAPQGERNEPVDHPHAALIGKTEEVTPND